MVSSVGLRKAGATALVVAVGWLASATKADVGVAAYAGLGRGPYNTVIKCQLSGAVVDAPQPNDEGVVITGPTWDWDVVAVSKTTGITPCTMVPASTEFWGISQESTSSPKASLVFTPPVPGTYWVTLRLTVTYQVDTGDPNDKPIVKSAQTEAVVVSTTN